MYGASQSFCEECVKDGNFRFHELSVFLLLCVSELSQNLEAGPRRGADALRYWFLIFQTFHDVSNSHSFPINVFTVIRTQNCRLRRSCIEGSSGSVGFKAATVFHSCSVSCGTKGYAVPEIRN